VFTLFGGYSFTENLSAELAIGQSIGNDSSSRFIKGNLVMQPFPDFTYSPYMTLGVGWVEVKTSTTLIASDSDTNNFAQVGFGIQRYISRSFLLRIEVNEYVVFSTSSTGNNNEVLDEWKIGFAVFY
jgi:opacity protein-like surface antigen